MADFPPGWREAEIRAKVPYDSAGWRELYPQAHPHSGRRDFEMPKSLILRLFQIGKS